MSKSETNPILTVIIPTYNSGKTLEVALKSIFNQTIKNIEILIIDGLSSDDTVKIAECHKLEFPNINVISEKDRGIYDAMNKGILMAAGTWLYFMGSDDSLYESTTVEQFLNREGLENSEIVYGNVYSTRFNGCYDGLFTYSKLKNRNICHQGIFFRKSIFSKIGVFNLKYKGHADWDHNIRWFFSSKLSKTYIDQIIANYADGGFSSIHGDEVFKIDKDFLLLSKGIGKLSITELVECSDLSIYFAKQEGKYFRLLVVYFFRLGLKIYRKIDLFKLEQQLR